MIDVKQRALRALEQDALALAPLDVEQPPYGFGIGQKLRRQRGQFLQDLFTNVGKHKNTLQFNMSVVNFLNLINHDWGIRKSYVVNNPLKVVAVTGGVPTYQLATYTPQGATVRQLVDRTFVNVNSTSTTWSLQFGLKYIF